MRSPRLSIVTADVLNVSTPTVRDWEQGVREPDEELLGAGP
ncbi:MAG TPA: hypothetical protein VK922_13165 [Gemmatimonadaceae bacterium]|nr:hypothetical protein [Gemmatimonadaceae bacterium]